MEKLNLPGTGIRGFLWHFIKKQKIGFSILVFNYVCWSLQESCYPYFIKLIIDKVEDFGGSKNELFSYLAPTFLVAASVYVFIDLNYRIFDFLSAKVYPKYMADIRTFFQIYIMQHSHNFFSNNYIGTIANRAFKLPEASQRIVDLIITIFLPVTMGIVFSCIILAITMPIFAVIVFVWFSIYMGLTIGFGFKASSLSTARSRILTDLNGKSVDILNNITTVKSFSNIHHENKLFSISQKNELKSFSASMKFNSVVKMMLSIVTMLFLFSTIGGSVYCYKENLITLGDLTMILSYYSLIGLVWKMGIEMVPFFDLVGSCRESLSIINEPHELKDIQNATELIVNKAEIKFENVTFNYEKNSNVFENKSITIKPLEKIGLVGFSGSGKTTFVNLIMRYFDVASGRITIDGQDISKVTQDSLRKNISLIPQEAIMFNRTVIENIRYGRQDASNEEVIEAAKKAHAHDFIINLSEGYNSIIGERGIKLSGGQRQRIAIARALLKNAPILILDEATSALDSITEKDIKAGLKELMEGKTVIVIAHRVSTLLDLDRILVFDKGNIVEDGSHNELIANKNSYYFKLWNMQSTGFIA